MAKETALTAFENGRIFNFKGLATLTLDRLILHTAMHHSSTSTYMPNFTEIGEAFCGWTDVCTHGQTDGHLRPTLLGQLRSPPKNFTIEGRFSKKGKKISQISLMPCDFRPP